jgi:Mrp family chromosome partitioning ATPase/capsular polysaccharide biosynthesis protein
MNETTDATAIFAPIWKRKWLILLVGLLVAAGAYAYYSHKPKVYEASTEIYLGGGVELQSLLGNSQGSSPTNSHALVDQAALINSNLIGEAVTRRLLAHGHRVAAEGTAQASASSESDFIVISGKAGTGPAVAELVNAYAQVYLRHRERSYRREVQAALTSTLEQLQNAEAGHGSNTGSQSFVVQDLASRVDQLRSQLSLGDAGNQQIDLALPPATPIAPKPTRNAIFGFVIGLVLAAIAAYVAGRFDRRLRSLTDIEDAAATPIIAALPSIRRPLIKVNGEPVPAQPLREPLRRLHTTLQLHALDRGGTGALRKVLFVSPEAGDGKSTLVAGLALAQREAGDRVVVVESDFRRPVQAQLLGVDGTRGLAEVLAGRLTLSEALQEVEVKDQSSPSPDSDTSITATQQQGSGSVTVLPGGGLVSNPPALLSGHTMPNLLASMSADFDFVLIDAPPPLVVSDVLPLLPIADAVIMVVRAGHTGEMAVRRLVELLKRSVSAPLIGVVVNDVKPADIEAFGFSTSYYQKSVQSRA